MTTYAWTDNAMQGGGACDVDKVNDNLMHLKYSTIPRNYIDGLIISNNVSDANNDIDISVGVCADSTNAVKLVGTAMTKRLDASWVAGANQGGLDTGSKASSTWYYKFIISKADGTTDYLFSTSATSPTMPTDYIYKRRIGTIRTDGSGNILAFTFFSGTNSFIFDNPITEVSPTTAVAWGDLVITAPPNTIPMLTIGIIKTTSNANASIGIRDKNKTNKVASINAYTVNEYMCIELLETIKTDSSSKIQYMTSGTNFNANIWNRGYVDSRGKE